MSFENSSPPVVLVVDDSTLVRRQAANALRDARVEVLEAADGEEALTVLTSHRVQLLITDINMPHMDGIQLLNTMAERGIDVATIVLTNEGQVRGLRLAHNAGAMAWVTKPFDPADLARSVLRILDERLHARGLKGW